MPSVRIRERVETPLDLLTARVEALEREIAALTAGKGLWSGPSRQLRRTLAKSTRGLPFNMPELDQHARVDQELATALEDAYLHGPHEIGAWLRDHQGTGEGITIRRVHRRWICTFDTSCAADPDFVK